MDNKEQTADKKLLVRIGEHTYSLPVSGVVSVIPLRADDISAVPFDSSGRIRGIFSYKGTVTALADCKGFAAQPAVNGENDLTAVVLQDKGRRFAILVDQANEVASETPEEGVIPLNVHALYAGEADDDNQ